MTEDSCPRVSSAEAADSSTTKQRKKRKWDEPAEYLVSAGLAVPGMLPLSNIGFLPATTLPGLATIASASFTNHVTATGATLTSVLQQHGIAIDQKLNQPKIQDELIAREIVINDADSALRYKLTKRQTQEEIQKCTGAIVITRGKFRPPDAPPDGEKPLYLHISAGAQLKTTAERIRAVDSAAAMVEEILKHGSLNNGEKVNHSLSTCVFLGFEADPSMNIAARIRGPNDQYVNHIMNETGATVLLRGRGSENTESLEDDVAEVQQPLHLFLSSSNSKSLERAKLLAENLLDTISAEFGASRVSSSKVYGAVPPPPQLLPGVQSSGVEPKPNNLPAASLSSSVFACVPSTVSSVIVPEVSGVASQSIVSQVEWSNPGKSQTTTGCNSLASLTRGTSYIGYGGIYPQATPLQQVALALRQSTSPMIATVAPSSTAGSSASHVSSSLSLDKDKRSSQKRKFQELPARVPANPNQKLLHGSELVKPCDLNSDANGRDVLKIPASKKEIEPSANGILSLLPKATPPPTPPPPPPPLPPVPKFTSPPPGRHDLRSTPSKQNSECVPDTLIKLMEYGGDDDDDDDDNDGIRRNSSMTATPKPFWAV